MFRLSAAVLSRSILGALLSMAAASSFAAGPVSLSQGKVEPLLAQDLAQRVRLDARQLQPRPLTDASLLPADRVAVSVAEVQPLAILPNGSDISQPEHLQGRSVCLAQAGGYAGLLQARFGAREQAYPSLAAALAGLKAGDCDALVHDSTVLRALVSLPDWKGFDRSFAVGQPRQLAVVLPASDGAAIAQLRQTAGEWKSVAYTETVARQLALRLSEEARRQQPQTASR